MDCSLRGVDRLLRRKTNDAIRPKASWNIPFAGEVHLEIQRGPRAEWRYGWRPQCDGSPNLTAVLFRAEETTRLRYQPGLKLRTTPVTAPQHHLHWRYDERKVASA